jgi:catechol 2,3-dioxygenase-like lactoylglutathione lyase family enzyme
MSDTGSHVQVQSAVPTFLSPDVAATARWYVDRLGFELTGHFPNDEPFAYASVQRGRAEIMLLSMRDYRKPDLSARRPEGLWDAYLRMRGVRALYEAWRDEPFIHMPLKHQPYGDWELEVRDPNGYVLVFGGEA